MTQALDRATRQDAEVLYERRGNVGWITLNRPHALNALCPSLVDELSQLLDRLRGEEVGCLVLSGAGRGFSAGADLRWLKTMGESGVDGRALMGTFHELVREIRSYPKPFVGAVNGPAVGGGMSLALLCDTVVAARSATFAASFVRIGLVPDLGMMHVLPRLVGRARARELMLSGRTVGAVEAERLGLVGRVVDDAEMSRTVQEIAGDIANNAAYALEQTRIVSDIAEGADLGVLLDVEARTQGMCLLSEDHRRAVSAFLEQWAARRG